MSWYVLACGHAELDVSRIAALADARVRRSAAEPSPRRVTASPSKTDQLAAAVVHAVASDEARLDARLRADSFAVVLRRRE